MKMRSFYTNCLLAGAIFLSGITIAAAMTPLQAWAQNRQATYLQIQRNNAQITANRTEKTTRTGKQNAWGGSSNTQYIQAKENPWANTVSQPTTQPATQSRSTKQQGVMSDYQNRGNSSTRNSVMPDYRSSTTGTSTQTKENTSKDSNNGRINIFRD